MRIAGYTSICTGIGWELTAEHTTETEIQGLEGLVDGDPGGESEMRQERKEEVEPCMARALASDGQFKDFDSLEEFKQGQHEQKKRSLWQEWKTGLEEVKRRHKRVRSICSTPSEQMGWRKYRWKEVDRCKRDLLGKIIGLGNETQHGS